MATYSRKKEARANKHFGFTTQIPRFSEQEMLDTIEEEMDKGVEPLILMLDRVQDPHNLGAILRSADASGVMFVIAPVKDAPPITETVRRIACGGAEHLPYVQVRNMNNVIRKLKDLNIHIIATSDHKGSVDLWDAEMTGPVAIIMGAEATGVRRMSAELSDELIRIPMEGSVECLNVSVATGVCLFEALRQRS
ncbi:MAG: 23S rRNA (guanosine(2251)-2'-O)-methyltransferase RlmB [Opitutales bacterium]